MYYLENVFFTRIVDCDARLWMALSKRTAGIDESNGSKQIAIEAEFDGRPHWNNLMVLCEAVHAGDASSMEEGTGSHVLEVAVTTTRLTKQLRGLSWEDCRGAIELVRPLAVVGDKRRESD